MKLLLAVVRPASLAALLATVAASMSAAQQSTPPRPAPSANGTARRPAKIDQARAESLCHGGFITAHLVMREETPFKAGAAIVRVTNLVFPLNNRGPGYQRSYATQPSIGGLPFEKPDEYIKRSPLYHVEQLHVPILVHVATNDLEQIDSWNRAWVFFERWLRSRNREPGAGTPREPRLPVPCSL